jgi:hypothetical protein
MTPSQIIDPFLRQADREHPDLAQTNTKVSCFALLKRTLELAGPDWYFLGKTDNMDGDGKYAPPGFSPFNITLTRPDGELQDVHIVAVSMDAAFHRPSGTQVKVIAFSTANEPGPWEHGPAHLTPYEIDPQYYRWHNPPVAQTLFGSTPQTPEPPKPPPTVTPVVPGREEALDEMVYLDRFYAAPNGLQRPDGLSIGGRPDFEGIAAWYLDVYQQARVKGANRAEARAAYVNQIRNSDEWKRKHPGETP